RALAGATTAIRRAAAASSRLCRKRAETSVGAPSTDAIATVAPAILASVRRANCAWASVFGGLAATSLQPLSIALANSKPRPAANALTGSFVEELTLDQLPPAAGPPRATVNKPLSRPRQQPAAKHP